MKKYIETILFRIKTSQYNPLLNKEYEQKNEDYKKLIKFCENKTIALVGGSKNLIKKNNKIDEYDLVIRVNNLPEKQMYEFVGKRCDILMLSRNPINLVNKNFIKIWMSPKFRYFLNYAKGDFYTYPYDMWENLNKILTSRPSTGAMALHFLTQKLPCSKIDLFGFDHKFSDVWYTKNVDKNHPHNSINEKKYFESITGGLVNYKN